MVVWITQVKESAAEELMPLGQWFAESRWDMEDWEGRGEHGFYFFTDWLEHLSSC